MRFLTRQIFSTGIENPPSVKLWFRMPIGAFTAVIYTLTKLTGDDAELRVYLGTSCGTKTLENTAPSDSNVYNTISFADQNVYFEFSSDLVSSGTYTLEVAYF